MEAQNTGYIQVQSQDGNESSILDSLSLEVRELFDKHSKNHWFLQRYHPVYLRERDSRLFQATALRQKYFFNILSLLVNSNQRNVQQTDQCLTHQQLHSLLFDLNRENLREILFQWCSPLIENDWYRSGMFLDSISDSMNKLKASLFTNEGVSAIQAIEKGIDAVNSTELDPLRTLFVRSLIPEVDEEKLKEILSIGIDSELGESIVRISYGEPSSRLNFCRNALVTYSSREAADKTLEYFENQRKSSTKQDIAQEQEKNETSQIETTETGSVSEYFDEIRYDSSRIGPKRSTLPVVSPCFNQKARIQHDFEQAFRLACHFDSLRALNPEENVILMNDGELLTKLECSTHALDILIHYLYRVHCYVYYTGEDFSEHIELAPVIERRACPKNCEIVRESNESMPKWSDFYSDEVVNRLDHAVHVLVMQSGREWIGRVDERAVKIGSWKRSGRLRHENISDGSHEREKCMKEWYESNTIEESEGRYRCKLPPGKLFMAPEFVHKHLRTKHKEKLDQMLEQVDQSIFYQNFSLDSNPLQLPMTSTVYQSRTNPNQFHIHHPRAFNPFNRKPQYHTTSFRARGNAHLMRSHGARRGGVGASYYDRRGNGISGVKRHAQYTDLDATQTPMTSKKPMNTRDPVSYDEV